MLVDYIIVGQGICGTWLSRQLLHANKSLVVIDNIAPNAAGRVAGGIINPVTGKRLVKSWLTDELLPFATTQNAKFEEELGVKIATQCEILDFHYTAESQSLFNEKQRSDPQYLQTIANETSWQKYFQFNYGIGSINKCMLIDMRTMIDSWRSVLMAKGVMQNETFSLNALTIQPQKVQYNNITASAIIFCDGASCIENPYFNRLPWSKDKGEALIVSIPDLPSSHIFKQNISIVPWQNGLFWVGASHDWKYTTPLPTQEFRDKVTTQLDYWLKLPYSVVDHMAALRPANFDRKPFVGMHPINTQIGIFNGMGGKGCSMAPYFANQFCNFLCSGTPIMPDVNVNRYTKILSR